jgi:hypothetical protein
MRRLNRNLCIPIYDRLNNNGSKAQLPSSALAERGGIRKQREKTAERLKLS